MLNFLKFSTEYNEQYYLCSLYNNGQNEYIVYTIDKNGLGDKVGYLCDKINLSNLEDLHYKKYSINICQNNLDEYYPNLIEGWFTVYKEDQISKETYYTYVSYPSNVFEDTMTFQQKYGLWEYNAPGFLEDHQMSVKIGHMKEELDEAVKAYKNKDLSGFADALVDLIYVASGCMNLMNLPCKQLWNDVHLRNMYKVRATKDTIGKRGSTFDVVKPADFVGPKTTDIINVATQCYKI